MGQTEPACSADRLTAFISPSTQLAMGNDETETKSLKLGLCALTLQLLYQGATAVVFRGNAGNTLNTTHQVRAGAQLQVLGGMENT